LVARERGRKTRGEGKNKNRKIATPSRLITKHAPFIVYNAESGKREEGRERAGKTPSPPLTHLLLVAASFLRTALATAAVVGGLGTGALLASSAERSTLSSRARERRRAGRVDAGAAKASCQMKACCEGGRRRRKRKEVEIFLRVAVVDLIENQCSLEFSSLSLLFRQFLHSQREITSSSQCST
jgi:hypothetical protein